MRPVSWLKNSYLRTVRGARGLVPYGYENSFLHYLVQFFAGAVFAVVFYIVVAYLIWFVFGALSSGGSIAGRSEYREEISSEISNALWDFLFPSASTIVDTVATFGFFLLLLGGYLVYVFWNRGWWDGTYTHEGRDRWKLLGVSTVVGGAGGVIVVLVRRGVVSGESQLTLLGYAVFVVGVVGFAHYFGETLLDDAANHGAEMDDVWRAVTYFEGQALAVVSAYAVFFGLPFSSAVGDIAVVSPFVFGGLYVGYRYATLGRGEKAGAEASVGTREETLGETDRKKVRATRGGNETAKTESEKEGKMDPTENLDKIRKLLESDKTRNRRRGLQALYVVAKQEPENASKFVPTLVEIIRDDHNQIRAEAAEVLWEIAKVEPEKAGRAADSLRTLLREKYPPAQRVALGALAEIAKEEPHKVSHLSDDALVLTDNPDNRIQDNSFRFLKNLGLDGDEIHEKKSEMQGNPLDNSARINKDTNRRERQMSDGDDDDDSKFLEPPPDLTFADVGGMRDLLDELNQRVVRPLRDPEVYEEHGASVVNGVLFHGPPGTGKTYTAKALAGELGYSFIQVHSSDVLSKYIGESANLIEDMFDTALDNQPCVVFFDEIDAIASERTGGAEKHQSQRQMVSELLRQLTRIQGERVVVMGATNILEEVDDAVKRRNRFDMLFEVPLPDAEAREEIFKVHLQGSPHEDSMDWDALAGMTEGYAAGDIETIVNHAAMKAAEEARRDGNDVVPICQRHLEAGAEDVEPSSKDLSGAADHLREPPDLTFDDVGGMDELKQELRELIIEPLENPDVYDEYGLATANGVLAHGPPGTGKTYTAEALAGELGYKFIVVKPDDIVSKWAGEAPNKMNEVFDVAVQNQPCLVLMDELDAIASERGSAGETRTERQTVNQLLTELERINDEDVIVLATTNAYGDLDPAVVRTGRFDRKIEFPPPDTEARAEILRLHLREPPVADGVDWDELARETDGLVASDLAAVAENAARKAVEDSKEEEGMVPVGQGHIEEAAEEVEPTLLKWKG